MDWANRQATVLTCGACRHILWFDIDPDASTTLASLLNPAPGLGKDRKPPG
jgi:hypothetical protein